MTTKVLISLEIDHFIYDLDEAHTEVGIMLHESLLPELSRTGNVKRAKWVLTSDQVGVPDEVKNG